MTIRRRDFVMLLGGAAAAWPLAARAQQASVPVIGFLSLEGPESKAESERLAAFRRGLREMGFIVDRNTAIEYRSAEGQAQKGPALAADLVQRRVSLIVADANFGADAKKATQTIPIVFSKGAIQCGWVWLPASTARVEI